MKKARLFAVLLSVMLMFSVFSGSLPVEAAGNTVTLTNAAQVDQLGEEGYNQGTKGPISITKGTLKSGLSSKTVYLVTLSGTEMVFNQATEVLTDLFSGFNLKSAYYYNVVNVINSEAVKIKF